MRFQRLHVPAFGPFTHLELNFPKKDRDLHVIYGDNEAGKSSLLRAIRDLLFGIPGQSPDNFLHDYKNLRLMGEIANHAGKELIFQRRKGNRNTLLDQDGNSLPDSALLPFLGSVDQFYFSAMFGLGSQELREGARQLLRGEGEVGNALFSASMGGTPIQHVMESLVEESERLFKGRATANVSIRPAVNRYKELLKQSRDAMVSPETWDKLEKKLEDQEAAKQRLVDELSELERQLGWLSRCEDALPTVGRLCEETRLLEELPELPEFASDFVERAQSIRTAANETSEKVQTLTDHITQLEGELTDCPPSPEFLAEAEALDVLHQDLGGYRNRKESLTDLQSKLAGIEPVLRAGMKNQEIAGELESLETLRLSSAVRLSCEQAANDLREALSKRDDASGHADKLKQDIESFEKDLTLLPEADLTPLRDALATAAEATDAHKTLAASEAEVEKLARTVAGEHALVMGAPKDLDDTAGLAVPAISTMRKFRERFAGIERDIKREEDRISAEGQGANVLQDELSRLERRGELPSEETLRNARSHRDHGWRLVLAEWKGEGAREELVPGSPLEEAFPQAIIGADDIADQLWRQAEAVAQADEKRFQIKNSRKLINEAKEKRIAFQNSLKECQAAWEAEWVDCGIKSRSPDEMEEWREVWAEFRLSLGRLRTVEATVNTKTEKIRQAEETLAVALGGSQENGFPVMFEAARNRVQEGEKLTGRRSAIDDHLRTHRKQLETSVQNSDGLAKAVSTATVTWVTQCQAVGLPKSMSPDSGLCLLRERKELLGRFDAWAEYSAEANKTTEAVQRYALAVAEQATALKIIGDTAEAQEAGLWVALTHARKVQVEHDQLAGQIKRAKRELAEGKQAETHAVQAMEELKHLAKVNTLEELETLLASLEERSRIQNRIDNFRETLAGPARGQSVGEFVARVQAENAEELPQRKARLESDQAEKKLELQAVQDGLAGVKTQKQELEKAGDAAADFRQQAESVAAALKQDASRFMRLRLAAHFLRTQIERFRQENQGPLLDKSGQVFEQITRGAFAGLGAEIDAEDIPIMVGRRADGSTVPVDGMSDGSRDQLYLALRLAALDRYLEEHEPMPLILDDLLTTFDDQRAKAILPELASLAKRTQIFLFTHHEHLVELCRQTLGDAQFTLHELVIRHPSKTTQGDIGIGKK